MANSGRFRRRNRFAVSLSLVLTGISIPVYAQDSTKPSSVVRTINGVRQVVLENQHVRLTFEPDRGGRCSEFLFKDNGEQIIGDEDVSGMFLDHWAKFAWPSTRAASSTAATPVALSSAPAHSPTWS